MFRRIDRFFLAFFLFLGGDSGGRGWNRLVDGFAFAFCALCSENVVYFGRHGDGQVEKERGNFFFVRKAGSSRVVPKLTARLADSRPTPDSLVLAIENIVGRSEAVIE